MKQLSGLTAYITGGTKGIGLGIAKSLLEQGMQVALSGRDMEAVQKVAESLQAQDRVLAIESDVRHYEDEVQAVERIVQKFGKLDVVIANAGLGIFKAVDQMELEDWNQMIDTNLTGVFHTLKSTVAQLKEHKGYFISIASLAGINFFEKGSGYNASKFGVVGFTQAAMLDLRTKDVKVTTILPGSVTSHFNGHVPSEEQDKWKIQPEDVGQLVVSILQMNANVLPSKIEIRPTKTAS